MARKKRDLSGGGGGGEWLNTYADMVTLLLTFFILLFSMSSLDAAKFNMLVTAFSNSTSSAKIVVADDIGGEEQDGLPLSSENIDAALQEIYESLKQYIESQGLGDSVNISQGEGYVFIQFMDNMLFEPNSAVLKASSKDILHFVGMGIRSVQGQCETISIHGFTASVPDNPNYPVNEWLLSSGRANAVLVYFDDDIGIDKEKMTATTWGMNKPIADNNTEEGRAKNRRVEILISTENLISEQLDNIYEKFVE